MARVVCVKINATGTVYTGSGWLEDVQIVGATAANSIVVKDGATGDKLAEVFAGASLVNRAGPWVGSRDHNFSTGIEVTTLGASAQAIIYYYPGG